MQLHGRAHTEKNFRRGNVGIDLYKCQTSEIKYFFFQKTATFQLYSMLHTQNVSNGLKLLNDCYNQSMTMAIGSLHQYNMFLITIVTVLKFSTLLICGRGDHLINLHLYKYLIANGQEFCVYKKWPLKGRLVVPVRLFGCGLWKEFGLSLSLRWRLKSLDALWSKVRLLDKAFLLYLE